MLHRWLILQFYPHGIDKLSQSSPMLSASHAHESLAKFRPCAFLTRLRIGTIDAVGLRER